MSAKDMLGATIRKIVDLPQEMLGVICDLVEKLAGESGQEWLSELKRFLRKENCWTGVVAKSILKLVSAGETSIIEACDGRQTIARAKKVFASGIDNDFENWGLDNPGEATPEIMPQVYELAEDATFVKMFTSFTSDLDKFCFTQNQIIRFCEKYPSQLSQSGATFFLFKLNGEYFVARVRVYSGGLDARVYRFEYDNVWHAEDRSRVVVPQF
jgi:hypothetical protein